MPRFARILLTLATVLLAVGALSGHAGNDFGPAARHQQVAVTPHEQPEPAAHVEALSGMLELHCVGCILEKRTTARTQRADATSGLPDSGTRSRARLIPARSRDLVPQRSPRAPPAA